MTKLKEILTVLIWILMAVGLQAQVTKAEYYTIKSNSDMFGIAIKSGSIIFNVTDKKTYLINQDTKATQSLESISG